MSQIRLAPLGGAPDRVRHVRAGEANSNGPGALDVLQFADDNDGPFSFVATAGMSVYDNAGPVPRERRA